MKTKQLCLALIGTALLFGSTACGNDDEPLHGPVISPTASATPEVKQLESGVVRSASVGTVGENEEKFSTDNFLMLSPETKFSISSYSTATSLELDGETVQPAEGEVFHLVSYDYAGSTVPFDFAANVNGEVISVPENLPSNGVLLISAVEDADINIEAITGLDRGIVDQNVDPEEGITQAINVKNAHRVTDTLEVLYKNPQGAISEGTLSGTGGTSPYMVTVSTVVQNAVRSGYVEGKGWANNGAAYITVGVTDVEYQMEKHGSAGEDGLTMMLRDHMGKAYIGEVNEDGDEYVFTVPLSEDIFTLHAEVNTGVTMSGNPVGSVEGLVTSEATITF